MKRQVVILALLAGTATLSAKAFEGTVTYKTLEPGAAQGQELTFQVGHGKFRIDLEAGGQGTFSVLDPRSKTSTTIIPANRTYVIMRLDRAQKRKTKAAEGKLVKSGKKTKILGYAAEEWVYTRPGKQPVSLWGNTELGGWDFRAQDPRGGMGDAMQMPAELADKGFFLLRMEEQGRGMEALRIKPGSLPASLFQVPAGYTRQSLPEDNNPFSGMDDANKAKLEKAMEGMTPDQREMIKNMMKQGGQ